MRRPRVIACVFVDALVTLDALRQDLGKKPVSAATQMSNASHELKPTNGTTEPLLARRLLPRDEGEAGARTTQ